MLDSNRTLNEGKNECDTIQHRRSALGSARLHIKRPKPYNNGKTWLRQKERSKAATIDVMILEGIHTVEEIAKALYLMCPNKKPLETQISLVEGHIENLQNGESWGGSVSTIPHGLKIKVGADKVVKFYLD